MTRYGGILGRGGPPGSLTLNSRNGNVQLACAALALCYATMLSPGTYRLAAQS